MPNKYGLGLLLSLLGWMLFPQAQAQDDALMTRAQADAVLGELRQIRQLLERMEHQNRLTGQAAKAPLQQATPAPLHRLQRKPAPTRARVDITGNPQYGTADAAVTLVEFVDYECPYCKRFYLKTYQDLKREYIDPGIVRLVVKDMPLAFHRQARAAARASHCAGEQNAYWPMHEKLFTGRVGLTEAALAVYAQELGLDPPAFGACMASDRHSAKINQDLEDAQRAGISGTPAFIIGRSGESAVEGAHVRGSMPFKVFKGYIDGLLEPTGDS